MPVLLFSYPTAPGSPCASAPPGRRESVHGGAGKGLCAALRHTIHSAIPDSGYTNRLSFTSESLYFLI